jgi:HEPN domain-containing protein
VEKYLKAFLIFNKIDFKRTHNIEHLLYLCSEIDKSFLDIEVRQLSGFGVDIRYPDDVYIPDTEEIKFYYELVLMIKDLIIKKLTS